MLHYNGTPVDLYRYVDVPAAIHRLQGNRKIYTILLRSFLHNPLHAHLADALDRGEVSIAHAFAQRIDGVAENLALCVLQQDARTLQEQLAGGLIDYHTLAVISENWDKTRSYVRYVLSEIEHDAPLS